MVRLFGYVVIDVLIWTSDFFSFFLLIFVDWVFDLRFWLVWLTLRVLFLWSLVLVVFVG